MWKRVKKRHKAVAKDDKRGEKKMTPFRKKNKTFVSPEEMGQIYNTLKSPYKKGAVMKFSEELCDNPTVFRYQDAWYMLFIKIDKQTQTSGYE